MQQLRRARVAELRHRRQRSLRRDLHPRRARPHLKHQRGPRRRQPRRGLHLRRGRPADGRHHRRHAGVPVRIRPKRQPHGRQRHARRRIRDGDLRRPRPPHPARHGPLHLRSRRLSDGARRQHLRRHHHLRLRLLRQPPRGRPARRHHHHLFGRRRRPSRRPSGERHRDEHVPLPRCAESHRVTGRPGPRDPTLYLRHAIPRNGRQKAEGRGQITSVARARARPATCPWVDGDRTYWPRKSRPPDAPPAMPRAVVASRHAGRCDSILDLDIYSRCQVHGPRENGDIAGPLRPLPSVL